MRAATLIFVLALAGCQLPNNPPEQYKAPQGRASSAPKDQTGIISALNAVRTDPRAHIQKLEAQRAYYHGLFLQLPGQVPLKTSEGVKALNEAAAALRNTRRLPALVYSQALADAARDHATDIGPKGLLSHKGTDGSTPADRIRRHAAGSRSTAEVISFGPQDPVSVVTDLLVDDGVPGRGHRKIMLDPQYRIAGAACGPHSRYRFMCVVDFADAVR